jgi:hypothetical protein
MLRSGRSYNLATPARCKIADVTDRDHRSVHVNAPPDPTSEFGGFYIVKRREYAAPVHEGNPTSMRARSVIVSLTKLPL